MSDDKTLVVGAAIDERFALPLLVTLRSAAENLAPGSRLEAYVIDHDIGESAMRRLELGVKGLPVEVHWRRVDLSHVVNHWPGIASDADLAIYARLYFAEVLPSRTRRILYLDADTLVRGDLTPLWTSPFDGSIVQAVPDAYAELLHVPRLRALGFGTGAEGRGRVPYFNAGVLLIDLERWRVERIREQAEALLWRHGERLFMREQDALNLCLEGRWKPVSPGWNFHELPHMLEAWRCDEFSRSTRQRAFHAPEIVRYIGCKPWTGRCTHAYCEDWWLTAGAAGIAKPKLSGAARFWNGHFRIPHAQLHWAAVRGIAPGRGTSRAQSFASQLLRRPWTSISYPAWVVAQRIRMRQLASRSPRR